MLKIKKEKKGKIFYGFLVTTNRTAAIPTMIATNKPAIAGRKYRSAIDGAGVGTGEGVAAGSWMLNEVSWYDGQ